MRKIMWLVLISIVGMGGCEFYGQSLKWCPSDENKVYTSFESISNPIIDQYGIPERVSTYNDVEYNFHSIIWYWFKRDNRIVVSFVDEECDGWYGWRIFAIGN